jgi:hypothetical protein
MHNEAHIDGRELQPRAERWHPSSASLSPLPSSPDFALGTKVGTRTAFFGMYRVGKFSRVQHIQHLQGTH